VARLGAEVLVLEGLPTFWNCRGSADCKEAKAFDKQAKIEMGVKVGESNQ
jgi:hypothetical protein